MMMEVLILLYLWDLVRRNWIISEFTPIMAGLIALLVVTAISCGMNNFCKRRDSEEDQETSSLGYGTLIIIVQDMLSLFCVLDL